MKDFMGQEIKRKDYMAGLYSDDATPDLFQVIGFTPKKVRLIPVGEPDKTTLKFPKDIIKLDPEVVEKLLTQPRKDLLGQDLEVGDFVYGADGAYIDPFIFEIKEFFDRKCKVKKVTGTNYGQPGVRYLTDLIKVDKRIVTMHCLTKDHR